MRQGECSIPAIHTTHKHIESFIWPEGQSLRQAWLYATGELPPNYPVPATRKNADIATNYLFLALCPFNVTKGIPCEACIDNFMDGLEWEYLQRE